MHWATLYVFSFFPGRLMFFFLFYGSACGFYQSLFVIQIKWMPVMSHITFLVRKTDGSAVFR